MEARGINIVNYTEDEIKKIMKLKDLKIILNRLPMLDNQDNSVEKCDSDSKSNIVSESVKDTSNTHDGQVFVDQMRKKMVSRVLKRERINRRGKYLGRRKRQQKLTRVNEDSNDDNTTHSENSESNEALNGINWEENIEVSSSLVDEFAPVVSSAKPKVSVVKKEESMAFERRLSAVIEEQARGPLEDESEKISAALDSIKSDANDAQEFLPGCGIYVKNYITSEWFAATVVEVDWEEEEVLVHYDDITKTDEWVSMNSQRLLRSKPETLGASRSLEESEIKLEKTKGSSESSGSNDAFMGFKEEPIDYQDISATIKKEREEEVETESVMAAVVSPKPPVTRPFLPPGDTKKESLDEDLGSPPIRMPGRRMKRKFKSRRGWKAKLHQPKIRPLMSKSYSKFKSGEKVLAKWSDHRMQKFPAIIKTVLDNGSYDVLFYDGFEKTIKEDHLYKTTEEEVAKYQHTNPSEADTFVDMDADSKEARRQRKKKTFDDYVFDPEQLTKGTRRKSFKEEIVPVKSRGNFGKSPPPAAVAAPSDGNKIPVDGEKSMLQSLHSGKGVRRKRKRGGGDKNESFDSSSDTAMKSGDPERSTHLERLPTKVQISSSILNDKRWKTKISPGVMPVNVECANGMIRKSVVVPDTHLSSGWSKHALLNPLNTWDIFLLSPDGYRILHQEDLKRYYYELNQNVPPSGLDFMTNVAILAELSLKQADMPPSTSVPRTWIRKKVGRGRKSLVPGVRAFPSGEDPKKFGRVKTLLPKCRFDQTPITPGSQTPGADPEDEWKCPKDGCSKHFRKESLLQMHIKHYHSELSSLVRNTPNMVDLACARSESVNSEWAHHEKAVPLETPKAHHPLKKIVPKSSPHSAGPSSGAGDVLKEEDVPISASPPSACRVTLTPLKKLMPDEKRSTIKTMLPIRSAEPQKQVVDTKVDSDEDFIEQKKNGSRIFKPGKLKKGRYIAAGSRGVEGYSQSHTIRFTKKKLAGVDKLQLTTDSNDSYPEEEKTSPTTEVTEDGVVIERLRSEEIINCTCNFREEDGLMIQCDICMCWQHGFCSDIENDTDVPEKYICHTCKNPFRVRSSKKYDYAQHYLTQGKLPTFRFSSRNDEEIKNRENMLKRCFEMSSSLHDIKNVESSLTAKINIAEQADHPKLYLWAKNWESPPNIKSEKSILSNSVEINGDVGKEQIRGPQPPEAPIDLEECRLRLLDHVDSYYQQIDDRLTSIQAQVAALESLDPDLKSNHLDDKQQDKLIKKTLHMLIRDISSIQKLAAIT